jgi:hypothetical protein
LRESNPNSYIVVAMGGKTVSLRNGYPDVTANGAPEAGGAATMTYPDIRGC